MEPPADSLARGVADSGAPAAPPSSIARVSYFDGQSSRKRAVSISFGEHCDIAEDGHVVASWPFADIRRVDGPTGRLRVSCLSALPLARLEIDDGELASQLMARCPKLDDNAIGGKGVRKIIGWSALALVSILLVVIYGVPLMADRLTPLVPHALEQRIGDAADKQVHLAFSDKVCTSPAGQAAFQKLVNALRTAGGLTDGVDAAVLSTSVPNAFALPGGKIYLFSGLLDKAWNSDEIAGVLAHELGHVEHRDSLRNLIYNGSTSYLIGLLFGDVTGSSALIFASRTMLETTYSREAEANADRFSIEVMHRLGRPTRPMGELLFRITGNEKDKNLSFLSNHPFTEDRRLLMQQEDRPPTAPPILSDEEWLALRAICKS